MLRLISRLSVFFCWLTGLILNQHHTVTVTSFCIILFVCWFNDSCINWCIFDCSGSLRRRGLFSTCREQGLLSSLWFTGSAGRLPGSGAQAQRLWCVAFLALRQVGSFQTRDQTRVRCTGRRVSYHWATREALSCSLVFWFFLFCSTNSSSFWS